MATTKKGIVEILSEIQMKLKAPKNQWNAGFGGYWYRNCEDILEALKPFLKEHKAHIILDDEIVQMGERFYIKAVATLRVESGAVFSTAFAREPLEEKGMKGAQLTGSSSSYARKYALNGLFAIDDCKDPDTQERTEGAKQGQERPETKSEGAGAGNEIDTIEANLACPKCHGPMTYVEWQIKSGNKAGEMGRKFQCEAGCKDGKYTVSIWYDDAKRKVSAAPSPGGDSRLSPPAGGRDDSGAGSSPAPDDDFDLPPNAEKCPF